MHGAGHCATCGFPDQGEGPYGHPPPSSAAEEGVRAPSPTHVEEPSGEARTPPDAPDRGKGPMALRPWWGGAHKARRPRLAPRMKWRRSRSIPAMVTNIFMSSISVGTTRPTMKRSRRSRRRRE